MVSHELGAQVRHMQTVGSILKGRRKGLKLTLEAVARLVGCTKGYLSAIENDKREHPPSLALLQKLEWALRLAPGSLVTLGEWTATPEPVRRRVLDLENDRAAARRLATIIRHEGFESERRGAELRRLVEHLSGAEGAAQQTKGRAEGGRSAKADSAGAVAWRAVPMQVPVLNRVSEGYPRASDDPARVGWHEYVSLPMSDEAWSSEGEAGSRAGASVAATDPDLFAVRVVGDEMLPTYQEGDIVVCSPEAGVGGIRDGSDCFVEISVDEDAAAPDAVVCTFRRVFAEAGSAAGDAGERMRLQPLNPRHAALTVARSRVSRVSAAVYVIRKVGVL